MSLSVLLTASLAVAGVSAAGQILAPTQDINFPSTETATDPLKWLGANGPWYAGMCIVDSYPIYGTNGSKTKLQAQRFLESLPRYPKTALWNRPLMSRDTARDTLIPEHTMVGSKCSNGFVLTNMACFNESAANHSQFSAANYTASGSLSFLHDWKPVLTNPALQIAMLNPTGSKEAHDFGYTLRTRLAACQHLISILKLTMS